MVESQREVLPIGGVYSHDDFYQFCGVLIEDFGEGSVAYPVGGGGDCDLIVK